MILFVFAGPNRIPSIFFLAILFFHLISCSSDPTSPGKKGYAPGTKEGYELAQYHCANCHQFVPAGDLDRATWKNKVLPAMAARLGITVLWESEYVDNNNNNTGGITFKDWQNILAYYLETAPETLAVPKPPVPYIKELKQFSIRKPDVRFQKPARTVMVSFDSAAGNIYTADYNTQTLYKWDKDLKITDSVFLRSPVVSANYYNDKEGRHKGAFIGMGRLNPENTALGGLYEFDLEKKLNAATDTLAYPLPRPIYASPGDMNNDGLPDWVVCSFGYTEVGKLSVWEQLPNGQFKENILINIPGATQVVINDFNNDGWNDIMALFAHAEESIRLFTNNKNGSFTEKKILDFPAVYGSTSFQLADFNKDGLPDILYSCGDNADISKIFKPYHGIYIYLNKGDFQFEPSFFYHINGCTKAVAADFDNDGDLDISTIALYSDIKNKPGENFLYFEQTGKLKFNTYSPPVEQYGRWNTMDVKDYDHDGDQDIILGNFALDMMMVKDITPYWELYLPMIVLENNFTKK